MINLKHVISLILGVWNSWPFPPPHPFHTLDINRALIFFGRGAVEFRFLRAHPPTHSATMNTFCSYCFVLFLRSRSWFSAVQIGSPQDKLVLRSSFFASIFEIISIPRTHQNDIQNLIKIQLVFLIDSNLVLAACWTPKLIQIRLENESLKMCYTNVRNVFIRVYYAVL